MNWREYIVVDPHICHGKASIRGTRVMASIVLDNLASGLSIDELLQSYPSLSRESVLATIAFAAELARDRTIELVPSGST